MKKNMKNQTRGTRQRYSAVIVEAWSLAVSIEVDHMIIQVVLVNPSLALPQLFGRIRWPVMFTFLRLIRPFLERLIFGPTLIGQPHQWMSVVVQTFQSEWQREPQYQLNTRKPRRTIETRYLNTLFRNVYFAAYSPNYYLRLHFVQVATKDVRGVHSGIFRKMTGPWICLYDLTQHLYSKNTNSV